MTFEKLRLKCSQNKKEERPMPHPGPSFYRMAPWLALIGAIAALLVLWRSGA
jgi:hypothetical protein